MTLSYEAKQIRQKVNTKDKIKSNSLDGTTTTQIIEFAIPAEKFTVQGSGDLIFTIHISVNGDDFPVSAAITTTSASEIATYSTNMVSNIKITRTAGSGIVTVLAN